MEQIQNKHGVGFLWRVFATACDAVKVVLQMSDIITKQIIVIADVRRKSPFI